MTGSAKGERASTGEWTEVASAKRGVRGPLSDELSVEVESEVLVRAGVRLRAAGRLFSSPGVVLVWGSRGARAGCVSDGPNPAMATVGVYPS